jgi:uncharacterized membrane protein YbhN (UPF0104 family)
VPASAATPIDRPAVTPGEAARRGPRLFAAPADEPRARRATDVILLTAGLVGIALAWAINSPSPGFARAVATFANSLPDFLRGLWQIVVDLLAAMAVAVVAAALVRRRLTLVRDLLLAAVLASALCLIVGRVADGSWPALWEGLRSAAPPPWYPSLRVAIPGAVVMTASPHLGRPVRRVNRWLVALGVVGTTALGAATPIGAGAGLLVAAVAAAATHLVFGSSGGRPGLDDVRLALAQLGVRASMSGVAERQVAGVFVVDAVDDRGEPLVVKVYGRDAHDTALVSMLWRTVWFREPGTPISLGRLQQVKHEALLTLLAGQAGVLTDRVVVAGATADDDALLVLRRVGRSVADGLRDADRDALLRRLWEGLARLHHAGLVHGQLDDRHLIVRGSEVGFVDFRGGSVPPSVTGRRTDEVQLLVSTVLLAGEVAAFAAAREALGTDGLATLLPYLQRPALTPKQRVQLREAGLDVDELRGRAAAVAETEAPALQQLRRLSLAGVAGVALPGVAALALLSAAGGFEADELLDALRDAAWLIVLAGLVVAQLPRLSQAVSTMGAAPVLLPLGPVYVLQLAVSYVNLAVPTAAGRIAINVRFFQRHGVAPSSAVAAGALDGVCGFVVQAGVLACLLLFSSASLDLELDGGATAAAGRILLLVIVLAGGSVAAVLAVARWRRFALRWARRLGAEALAAVRGLRSTRRLAMLLGGNLATEVLFAAALGTFLLAVGHPVGIGALLVVNVSAALLSGLMPVPGGIGVAEGALTYGLVNVGVPDESAFTAVILYRLATFYLPPIWGFLAFRWLQRNEHL